MPTLEDLRPLYCQLGYSTKSDGSAQLSQGRTTVLAGVYGPVEVKRNREKPDRMDVEVTLQPRVGQSCVENRTREAMIRDITEACVKLVLHPRAGVNLSIHVLEQDEGVRFDKVFNVHQTTYQIHSREVCNRAVTLQPARPTALLQTLIKYLVHKITF